MKWKARKLDIELLKSDKSIASEAPTVNPSDDVSVLLTKFIDHVGSDLDAKELLKVGQDYLNAIN